MSSVPPIDFSWDALTVSYQYVGECAGLPAPLIDLYCPQECHCDHNEIEDHDTAPGHRQILGRTVSRKKKWLIMQEYPRHALPIGNEEWWVSERLKLTN